MTKNAGTVTMLAQLECQDVALRFYRHLDERRYDEMADLMHPSGTWSRQGTDVDKPSLAAVLTKGRTLSVMTHHLLTNLVATQQTNESVTVIGYLVVFRYDDGNAHAIPVPLTGPSVVSDWRCEFRLASGDWRIFRLQSRPTFESAS